MSYDVCLVDSNGDILPFSELFQEGGIQAIGGVSECELNITYNYCKVFGSLVRDIHGLTAEVTMAELKEFVALHPDAKPDPKDYWAPTTGNAKVAIERLITFAEEHPEGVWRVS